MEPCFIFLQYPKIFLNILFTNSLSFASFRRCHSDIMKFLITKTNRFICGFSFSVKRNLKNSCQRLVYHVIILYTPLLLLYQSRLTVTEDLLYRRRSCRRRLKVGNGCGNGAGNGTRNLRRLTSRFINLILYVLQILDNLFNPVDQTVFILFQSFFSNSSWFVRKWLHCHWKVRWLEFRKIIYLVYSQAIQLYKLYKLYNYSCIARLYNYNYTTITIQL